MRVREYLKEDGSSPFNEWLNKLDGAIKYRVQARIYKLRDDGHFGVTRKLSDSLFELKFKNLGGGIRVYYGREGANLILLLCGGNKGSQEKDIRMAHQYWNNYLSRDEKE